MWKLTFRHGISSHMSSDLNAWQYLPPKKSRLEVNRRDVVKSLPNSRQIDYTPDSSGSTHRFRDLLPDKVSLFSHLDKQKQRAYRWNNQIHFVNFVHRLWKSFFLRLLHGVTSNMSHTLSCDIAQTTYITRCDMIRRKKKNKIDRVKNRNCLNRCSILHVDGNNTGAFNPRWFVVAIAHRGMERGKTDQWQTTVWGDNIEITRFQQ